MKQIHRDLLILAQTRDLGTMTYREIGELLGGEHPYQVQYNIRQLVKQGKLLHNLRTGSIYPANTRTSNDALVSVPVMGSVSCGVAIEYANNEEKGFISVSPSLINAGKANKLFALKASGDSMDLAHIGNNTVEDGDYVLVRQSEWGEAREGDYVVSLIEDCANLKRLHLDQANQRVILLSESAEDYAPIIIAKEDLQYYRILGIAVDVIKSIPTFI
ncbi:MAG TPA: S24 family peptidase [Candidatus Saccharimonadales bacterium]|nr:S24 family peptidase [Candidatus Saccharimonadales bacterium]